MQRFVTAAAVAGSIVLAGCASKPPAALPPQPANVAQAVERSQAPQGPSQGIENAVVPGSNADFLASLGVDANRITTISYGKERPVALGSNEEAWAKNRRDVTVVIE